MKKIDKAKINKALDVFGNITALVCFIVGIITQLDTQDTTQALCWVIVGILASATKVGVN